MSDTNTVSDPQVFLLTDEERRHLQSLEACVIEGQKTFLKVGNALREISDSRLYRETCKTFEEYVEEKFGFTRGHAYNLIASATAAENVASKAGVKPISEFQLRPLIKLEPEQQKAAWEKAVVKSQGKRPTHDLVKAAVAEVVGKKAPMQFTAPQSTTAPSAMKPNEDYWVGELSDHLGKIDSDSVDLLVVSTLEGKVGDASVSFEKMLLNAGPKLKASHQVLLFCPSIDYRAFVAVAEAHRYEFGVPLILSLGRGPDLVSFSYRNEAQLVLHFRKGDAALQNRIGNVVSATRDASIPGLGLPLDLVEELIEAAVPAGATVLDPTSGAAATVAACRRTGRHGIGMEPDAQAFASNLVWLNSL